MNKNEIEILGIELKNKYNELLDLYLRIEKKFGKSKKVTKISKKIYKNFVELKSAMHEETSNMLNEDTFEMFFGNENITDKEKIMQKFGYVFDLHNIDNMTDEDRKILGKIMKKMNDNEIDIYRNFVKSLAFTPKNKEILHPNFYEYRKLYLSGNTDDGYVNIEFDFKKNKKISESKGDLEWIN